MWENINHILQRETIAKDIKQILTSFEENCRNVNFKKGIYIYGSPGCGKTRFVCNLLESLNYDVIKYDAGDVRNKALIDTITCNNISNRNVLSMMSRCKKPIAIVMDEIDEMNNGDKRGITSLIKLIRQKKTKKQKLEHVTLNPIICIGNYYVDKKMKELKKVCHVFELKPPTRHQMSKILQPRLSKNTTDEHSVAQSLILDFVQGDLRKFVFIENMLRTRPEFLDDPAILENIFQIKTYNDDTKKITHRLLQKYIPLEQHNQVLNETDRTIISLLYHENMADQLWYKGGQQPTIQATILFYTKFLENLCYADNIDRITFQNQIWIFNEMSSMIKTFYNNYLYHKHKDSLQTPTLDILPDAIRFTKVLTKYSTEYNNQLFLYNMCQEMDMDKNDVVAFFQELLLLLCPTGSLTDASVPSNSNTAAGDGSVTTIYEHLDDLFQATEINRLDIKRMYRFLDKNSETFDINSGKKTSTYLNMMDGENEEVPQEEE